MGDWRRGSQRKHRGGGGGYYDGGGRGSGGRGDGGGDGHSRFSSWKPPSGNKQATVPTWEKEFCYYVGRIPWKKLLESKALMPIYKNVVQWDDSAGEEAFHNAKARFWAEMNSLPCNIPMPDPDMYIDEIDWNCKIDPQLIADLEKKPPPPPAEDEWKSGHLRSGWDSCLVNEPIVPTGWMDAEDHANPIMEPPVATGWEDWGDMKDDAGNSGWGSGAAWDDAGVVKKNEQWGNWESDNKGNDNDVDWKLERWKGDADNYYSEARSNNKKRGGNGGGRFGSRNPNSGYKGGDGYHANNSSWRNCRGRRRMDQGKEWTSNDKEHASQWQWSLLHSCGPVHRQTPGEAHGAWPPIS